MDLRLVGNLAQVLAQMPVMARADMVPLEGGSDPAFGSVKWRTLFSADRTPTEGMVMGVAEFGPHGTLNAHRHGPAEIYYGLEGTGMVTIDGVDHMIAPGVALFIPSEAEHRTIAGPDGLRFLYVFARDCFEDVDYRFSAA